MWPWVTRRLRGPRIYCLNTCYLKMSSQPCGGLHMAVAAVGNVHNGLTSNSNGCQHCPKCILYINSFNPNTNYQPRYQWNPLSRMRTH